jgi:hypothetical protein
MSGAIPSLPQYAFMAWCSVKAQGQLYIYLYHEEESFLRGKALGPLLCSQQPTSDPCPESGASIPHLPPNFPRTILLSSHLRIGLPSGLFSPDFPCLIWNPKVHCRVHNSPPLVPIFSQVHLVHTFPPNFPRFVLILSSHLRLGLPSALPLRFTDQNFIHVSRLSHAFYNYRPSFPSWLDYSNNI